MEGGLFSAGLVMSSEHSVGFTGTRYHGSSLLRSLWLRLPVTSLGAMPGILRLHETRGPLASPSASGMGPVVSSSQRAQHGRPGRDLGRCVQRPLRLSHVSRDEKACYFGCVEISPSPGGQVMFLFLSHVLLVCCCEFGCG